MNEKELKAASLALLGWLESQDIDHPAACAVLGNVLSVILATLPNPNTLETFKATLDVSYEIRRRAFTSR